jgi:hypothetical protein
LTRRRRARTEPLRGRRNLRGVSVRLCLRVCVAPVLLLLSAGCNDSGPLQVSEARVRALIPGQDKTVGYFTARNTSNRDIVLSGARSAQVRAIEMHTIIRDGEVARMRRLEEVVIHAGDTVRFEPGGRHLMLFGASELGTAIEIVLEARDGRQFQVRFATVTLSDG